MVPPKLQQAAGLGHDTNLPFPSGQIRLQLFLRGILVWCILRTFIPYRNCRILNLPWKAKPVLAGWEVSEHIPNRAKCSLKVLWHSNSEIKEVLSMDLKICADVAFVVLHLQMS